VSAPGILTEGLTKRFGDFTAVDSVDLRVEQGEVFGFLGPNGCGKSTTIRMLCGLIRPTEGRATVAGLDAATQAERIRERVGYVGQFFYLYGDLTVAENMEFFGGIYGVPDDELRRRVAHWQERLGLSDVARALAHELALGVQRRLSLACAVLHNPPVLLLDEPTSGVDPGVRRAFFDVIRELADGGTTVLVTTHVMDEAERCGRLALMNQGRVRAVGSPAEIKAMSGSAIYAYRVGDLSRALDLAESHPSVRSAQPFGTEMQVQLREGDGGSAARIAAFLREQGVECGDPRAVRPTIEHTFLRLLGTPAGASEGGDG
jgi:ABC-2 type transport system ATP-binding protein